MNIKNIPLATTLACALGFANLTLLVAPASSAHAAAPMVKKSAPGYYRTMLGDFEITALSDGTFAAPVDKLMKNTSPAAVDKALKQNFMSSPIDMSINGYLINTGSKLILVDTGLGQTQQGYGPGAHHLVENLKAAGYTPDQVDEIYLTHMHPDHIGGLIENGQPVFPNAIVRADKNEAAEYLGQANIDKAPEQVRFVWLAANAAMKPYIDSGRFKPFNGATPIIPGISAVPAPGHTNGHTMYAVESKGEKLLLLGDILHLPAMQFDNPDITIVYDTDDHGAAAERKKVYTDAAAKGYLVGGAHISFPGMGHIRKDGKRFVWIPVNYKPMY